MGTFQKQDYVNWIHSEVATRIDAPEYWRPIEGYENKYKISTNGRIVNWKTGYELRPHVTKQGSVVIALFRNRRSTTYNLKTLMWQTFVGRIPKGYRVATKSPASQDCRLENLKLVTKTEWLTKIGKSGRAVIKINKQGKVVKLYRTAVEAGIANCYSPSTLSNRCKNGEYKKPAADGCDYAYEDDPYSIRRALVRLGVDWREWDYDNSGQV